MKLHALDIPENPQQLGEWLEGHLVGLNLAALVAELVVVHGRQAEMPRPLDEILGGRLIDIRNQGLSAVSSNVLQQLLVHPQCLLDLQTDVLQNGGAYWDQLASRSNRFDLGTISLPPAPSPLGTEPVTLRSTQPVVRADKSNHWRRLFVPTLAAAAALMVAAFVWQASRATRTPVETAWGWNSPNALTSTNTPSEYFNQLADHADEWFKKRPQTADQLAQRILQFRQGCSKLIFAEHRPLKSDDRIWLVDRCRTWAGKLDQLLVELEAGQPVNGLLVQVDETVEKLSGALRDRARQASAQSKAS